MAGKRIQIFSFTIGVLLLACARFASLPTDMSAIVLDPARMWRADQGGLPAEGSAKFHGGAVQPVARSL